MKAMEGAAAALPQKPDFLLVDGNRLPKASPCCCCCCCRRCRRSLPCTGDRPAAQAVRPCPQLLALPCTALQHTRNLHPHTRPLHL